MNLPRLVAFLSIIAALLTIAWVLTHLEDESGFGPPRTKDTALPAYAAAIPRIGDFKKEFNINEVNPFVPFAVSQRAEEEIKALSRPKPPPPVIPLPPPPAGPVIVEEPKKPQYPPLSVQAAGAPECLGVVRKGDRAVLIVSLPGEPKVILEVGEEVTGWKLQAIGVGVASFSDPAGATHELPIGSIATPESIGSEPPPAALPSPTSVTVPPARAPPLRPGGPPQQAPPMVPLRPK